MVLTTVRVGLPISMNPAQKLPHIHAKKFAFHEIPHCVRLIVDIHYHGSLEHYLLVVSLRLRSKNFIKPIGELNVAHLDRGAEEALLKPARQAAPSIDGLLQVTLETQKAGGEEESSYIQTCNRAVSEDEASGHSLLTNHWCSHGVGLDPSQGFFQAGC